MKVRARNFCGLASADFDMVGITLVGGENNAGKSSLLQGVAAAALRDPLARGMKKKDAKQLVREGTEAGSVTLDWGTGKRRVSWPTVTVEESGDAAGVSLGSALGIGAVRFSSLDMKQRAMELTERLGLTPTRLDLDAFLAGEQPKLTKEVVDALWEDIDVSGWDAVHKRATDGATKLKGRWEAYTGERWGQSKAAGWRPGLILEDEDSTIEEAAEEEKAARTKLQQLLADGAVTDKALADAQAAAEDLTGAQKAEAEARAKIATMDAALNKLVKKRESLAPLATDDPTRRQEFTCPCCEKKVWLRRIDGALTLVVPDPPKDEKAQAALEREHASVTEAITAQQRKIDGANEELQIAVRRRGNAEKACERLAALKAKPKVTEEDVAAGQAAVATAEARREAVTAYHKAREVYEEWLSHQPMIKALAPDGVRAKKVKDGLDDWRRELADLSTTAGWREVSISGDLEITVGGRIWPLLSVSEQWRADLLITLSLAKREKAQLVLVDALDVLHVRLRPGALKALRATGIPALVAATVTDQAAMPQLERVGFGRCYWIGEGRVEHVSTN